MDIASYSITRKVNVWLMVIIFLVGGLIGFKDIGRLEDPAFTIKQAMIFANYPGASAKQVEDELVEPLEIALQSMPQLNRVTSISKPGSAQITVEIKDNFDGTELPQVWDEMRRKVNDTAPTLPQGVGPIQIIDDFGDVYGLYYALIAPDFTDRELRDFSKQIKREILTVDGVAKVSISGVTQEQITAYINESKLATLGISLSDVSMVIGNNINSNQDGRLFVDGTNIRLSVERSANQLDGIRNIPIVVPGTTDSIRVGDIAEFKLEKVDIPDVKISFNSNDAVTIAVSAQNETDIVKVGKSVDAKIAELMESLPIGMKIEEIYNQGKVVEKSVDGFVESLIVSVAVVVVALCLFMGWRSGVVVGTTLVVTVMGTIMIMWLYGLQLQRISLGALVIAMGMLVDNAIVVAEGMMISMKRGQKAIEAASFIVKRTIWPLLGATVIGIAAFSGIGLSDDATGEFLFSLYAVILISLILSWLLAITLTPVLGKMFYKTETSDDNEKPSLITRAYEKSLSFALRNRALTILTLVIITIASYASFGFVKQGFFPPSDTPLFQLHYWSPQNRDIRTTIENMTKGEEIILSETGVVDVTSFSGRGADRFSLLYAPQQPNESYGFYLIRVEDSKQINDIVSRLVPKLQMVDSEADYYPQIMMVGPSTPAKLQTRISGPDPDVLREIAGKISTLYYEDGKIRNIRDDWREKGMVIAPRYDEIAAGKASVSRSDFVTAMQYASNGYTLGTVYNGDYTYPIVAKKAEADKAIEDSLIWSSSARRYVPFKQVSEGESIHSEEGQINRRDRVRTITVSADEGLNETAAEAFARMQPQILAIELPEGYTIDWGGEYESSRDAQLALAGGLPVSFLIMFVISVLLFGQVRQPLIIWLIVPMAIVGVVSGLIGTQMPFGFMSLLGFLSLFGMLIKNAIVLLEEIDLQIEETGKPYEALVSASSSRLRPVSLAAITTIFGMAPLLSDPFFADMSVTIMGGLTFATILTLIAVPVLYSSFYKIKPSKL